MQMQSWLGMAAFSVWHLDSRSVTSLRRVENRCVTAAALPAWLRLPLALQPLQAPGSAEERRALRISHDAVGRIGGGRRGGEVHRRFRFEKPELLQKKSKRQSKISATPELRRSRTPVQLLVYAATASPQQPRARRERARRRELSSHGSSPPTTRRPRPAPQRRQLEGARRRLITAHGQRVSLELAPTSVAIARTGAFALVGCTDGSIRLCAMGSKLPPANLGQLVSRGMNNTLLVTVAITEDCRTAFAGAQKGATEVLSVDLRRVSCECVSIADRIHNNPGVAIGSEITRLRVL